VNWTLEVVQVPVTDIDRAKAFYAEQVGFAVDHDTSNMGDGTRFAQLTPPGSGCSIVISTGMTELAPGAQEGLQLVVNDVRAARAELAARGVDVSEVRVYTKDGVRPAREDDVELNNVGFCFFSDPDGNGWAVQQITSRP
jgi:catechol 2,3-dioxygenase-like lactoylglutathione lyase family enzyme